MSICITVMYCEIDGWGWLLLILVYLFFINTFHFNINRFHLFLSLEIFVWQWFSMENVFQKAVISCVLSRSPWFLLCFFFNAGSFTSWIYFNCLFKIALWLSWLVCRRQILTVRFGVRILLVTRKVFRLDNSILTKNEIYFKFLM